MHTKKHCKEEHCDRWDHTPVTKEENEAWIHGFETGQENMREYGLKAFFLGYCSGVGLAIFLFALSEFF